MRRFSSVFGRLARLGTVAAIAVTAVACDDAGPTAPDDDDDFAPASITETFTGVLARNGAVTFPFFVSAAGTATATITAVTPDNTIAIGMTMGTWNGVQCAAVISNDNALENAQVVGSAGQLGTLCLRVHDVGRLSAPLTFTIKVTHP